MSDDEAGYLEILNRAKKAVQLSQKPLSGELSSDVQPSSIVLPEPSTVASHSSSSSFSIIDNRPFINVASSSSSNYTPAFVDDELDDEDIKIAINIKDLKSGSSKKDETRGERRQLRDLFFKKDSEKKEDTPSSNPIGVGEGFSFEPDNELAESQPSLFGFLNHNSLQRNQAFTSDKVRPNNDSAIRPEDEVKMGPYRDSDEKIIINGQEISNIEHKDISEVGLIAEVVNNLEKLGITQLHTIQQLVVPRILEMDRDIVAYSRTGKGKTFAYIMAIVSKYVSKNRQCWAQRNPQVVILFENHEAATQAHKHMIQIANKLDLMVFSAIGSIKRNIEIQQLKRSGGDVVISTTGRFIDYVSEGIIKLDMLEILIFDEAEHFVKDEKWQRAINIINANAPANRRTFLFSATYDDKAMESFKSFVRSDHWFLQVGELNKVTEQASQTMIRGKAYQFQEALIKLLIDKAENEYCTKTIVFTNSKESADFLASRLRMFRDIPCPLKRRIKVSALHADLPARDREYIFSAFQYPPEHEHTIDVIVASDKIKSGISTPAKIVVNYDIPVDYSTYVLRAGRTARNYNIGECYTFVDKDQIYTFSLERKRQICRMFKDAIESNATDASRIKYMTDFISLYG